MLGFKSPLAYKSSFMFTGIKNGWKRTWLMYEGDFENKIDPINETETKEENGVKVTISVDRSDVREFSNKIKEQLAYFSNVYITDEYNSYNNDIKIYENDLFKWSANQSNNKMHVALDQVYYELDYKKLGISDIYIPIAIKIRLDEGVIPTLNRESFMMTPQTKELILTKIKNISNWFITKYNENVKSFNTLLEAWNHINVTIKTITIEEKAFEISSLQQFSDVKFLEPKVKGISLINLIRYKTIKEHLVKGYNSVGRIEHGGRMSNSGKSEDGLIREHLEGRRTLLIDNNLSGHFREYVKTLGYKHFVRTNKFNDDLKYYEQILTLADYSKDKWEDVIKEWKTIKEQFCNELFTDGTKYHISQDFLDYKEANKTKSSYVVTSSYKRLNKVSGQVVINHYVDSKRRNELKLDRYTENIDVLHKKPYLTLVFEDENKDKCRDYTKSFQHLNNIKFIILGKNDYKTISSLNIKNVKMFAKTQPKEIRLFKQISTAILFNKALTDFEKIYSNASEMIKECMTSLSDDRLAIKAYIKKYEEVKDNALTQDIIDNCKEYDLTLWKEYTNLLQANKDLSFLKWTDCPSKYSGKYNEFVNFINEQLLIRKLTGKYDLSQFEICVVKEEKVEKLEEEFELV